MTFEQAIKKYIEMFDATPPLLFGISEEELLRVVSKAIDEGKPIPEDYDWYWWLPKGAVA